MQVRLVETMRIPHTTAAVLRSHLLARAASIVICLLIPACRQESTMKPAGDDARATAATTAAAATPDRRAASKRMPLPVLDLADLDPASAQVIQAARAHVRDDLLAADGWGQLGMTLMAHDILEPAARCFAQAARLDGNEARWPYFEAIAVRAVEPETAIVLLEQAAQRFGDEPNAAGLRLAELLIDRNQLEQAKRVLEGILNKDPANAWACRTMGRIHLLQKNFHACLTSLQGASEHGTPSKQGLLLAAEAHRRLGDLDAATRDRARAAKQPNAVLPDPHYQEIVRLRTGLKTHLTHADDLFVKGRVDESIKIARQAIAEYPDSEWARILLARGLIRQRRLDQAKAVLRETLRLAPNSYEAHFRMGVAFQVAGDFAMAVNWFEKTIELNPRSAVAYRNSGMCNFATQNYDAAEEDFKQAVEVAPNYFDGHMALGNFYIKVGKQTRARAALLSASRLKPDDRRVKDMLASLGDDQSFSETDLDLCE